MQRPLASFARRAVKIANGRRAVSSSTEVHITDEVQEALASGRAVVALESTIISHGMPYPQNLETALAVEAVVRSRGAIPATVAIIGGLPKVGLDAHDLQILAGSGGRADSSSSSLHTVRKCSRRDLALTIAAGGNGATTVAATMILAARAGISLFATGGIGGVHRGGEVTMDVSADLMELGRTPVTVVCAGIKSILDIPRTLEVLETQGVPVLTLGADEFPAFFTGQSGVASPNCSDSPAEIAAIIHASRRLGLTNGMVVAVPPPISAPGGAATDREAIEAAIRLALSEAAEGAAVGPAVTPYVLKRVAELTGGRSLAANVELIKHNSAVATEIAVHLVALQQKIRGGGTRGGSSGGDSATRRDWTAGAGKSWRKSWESSWTGAVLGERELSATCGDGGPPVRDGSIAGSSSTSSGGNAAFSSSGASSNGVSSSGARSSGSCSNSSSSTTWSSGSDGGNGGGRSGSGASSDAIFSSRRSGDGSDLSGNSKRGAAAAGGKGVVTVVGAAIMDRIARPDAGVALVAGSSAPGSVTESYGGVGRNIAEVLAHLGTDVTLVSAVGDDATGAALLKHAVSAGINVDGTVKRIAGEATACYVAVLDGEGELQVAVADARIMRRLGQQLLGGESSSGESGDGSSSGDSSSSSSSISAAISRANLVIADGNLPPDGFAALARQCSAAGVPLLFEPTSVAKCMLPVEAEALPAVALATPNCDELLAMARAAAAMDSCGSKSKLGSADVSLPELLFAATTAGGGTLDLRPLRPFVSVLLDCMLAEGRGGAGDDGSGGSRRAWLDRAKHLLVTLGPLGVLLASAATPGGAIRALHLPAPPVNKVLNCTGAGDALAGGLAHGIAAGAGLADGAWLGMLCARQSLLSEHAVPAAALTGLATGGPQAGQLWGHLLRPTAEVKW